MCAFEHGKGAVLWLDDAVPTLRDLSAYLSSADFNRAIDTPESTTFTKNDRTYIPGLAGATLSISGFWDSTATTGPDEVLSENVGKSTTSTFYFGPQGDVTGDILYHGECILTSYVVSAPVDGIVSFTADLQVTGVVTRGSWPV